MGAEGKRRLCSSNMNRSMEAHSLLGRAVLDVESYGTGEHVKLPGPSLHEPNVYDFGTPYGVIYDDLRRKDPALYKRNCLLPMLKGNTSVKLAPQQWQDNASDRVLDMILTRGGCLTWLLKIWNYPELRLMKSMLIVNMDVRENHEAGVGAKLALELCQKLKKIDGYWEEIIDDVMIAFKKRNSRKDRDLYKRNGLLPILKRNNSVKMAPQRWQDNAGDGLFHMESHCNLRHAADNTDNEPTMDQCNNVLQGAPEKLSLDSATAKCKHECGLPDGVLLLMKSEGRSSVPRDPIIVTIEEEISVSVREGDDSLDIEIHGKLLLLLPNAEDRSVQLQVCLLNREVIPGLNFTMHPAIDKDLFMNERIVKLKDTNKPFATGQTEVIRWRTRKMDESLLPLEVSCYTFDEFGGKAEAELNYRHQKDFVLENCTIEIYLPESNTATVRYNSGGEHKRHWDRERIVWFLPCIHPHSTGSIEIVAEYSFGKDSFRKYLETSASAQFESSIPFSGIKVASANLAYAEKRLVTGRYPNVYPSACVHENVRKMLGVEWNALVDGWGDAWPDE